MTTTEELNEQLSILTEALTDAQAELNRCVREHVSADHAFELAWARAILQAKTEVENGKAVSDKVAEARATVATDELRFKAKLAEGLMRSASQALHNTRAQL